ncbi:MAG: glycosyltransferase family 2 protein [bacterium]|nr:glycosyltransferase family 2 protein [bacterium]
MLPLMTSQRSQRLLEVLPGVFIMVTTAAAVALAVVSPRLAVTVIVLFDLYWLFRMYYLLLHVLSAWGAYRRSLRVDWATRLEQAAPDRWRQIWHLVILPTHGEPYAVVARTLESLRHSRYSCDRMLVVLAGEARDGAAFLEVARQAKTQFGSSFARFEVTVHPDGLPHEIAGKGSNLRFAGLAARRFIDELQLPYDRVIVSSFDVDTCPHPQYFALLTLTYLREPRPARASYQPIAMYTNNVWASHPLVRVVAGTTTFWLLTDLARAERLFTFSSHSMSLAALVDVDFWDPGIVTEDSRIFLQCLEHYGGDYRVVPIFLPVSMNTVDVGDWLRSLVNQYRQIRRWAWSVEHFPWMAQRFFGRSGRRSFPLAVRVRYFWNLMEGMYSWVTAPLLIFLFSRAALALARSEGSVFLERAGAALGLMANLGLAGLVIFAVLYWTMLPQKEMARWWDYPLLALQWALTPLTLVVWGSLPALEAQLRLMLGGRFRLGFDVTEKV